MKIIDIVTANFQKKYKPKQTAQSKAGEKQTKLGRKVGNTKAKNDKGLFKHDYQKQHKKAKMPNRIAIFAQHKPNARLRQVGKRPTANTPHNY